MLRAILRGASLTQADMRPGQFVLDSGASRSQAANLSEAKLDGADLRSAQLDEANLSVSSATGANFANASLFSVNLAGADLSGANLTMARFKDVNLIGARLEGALLQGRSEAHTSELPSLMRNWYAVFCL